MQLKKSFKGVFKIALGLLLVAMLLTVSVSAAPYNGYNYNLWDETVPSQIGYLPSNVYNGLDFGGDIGYLSAPQDLFVTDDVVYILDSGNNRVVVSDLSFKATGVIDSFSYNGETLELNQPTGIFVTPNETVYIADPQNGRVLVTDKSGNVKMLLEKPQTNMLEEEFLFQPSKVLVDSSGMIYVTVSGLEKGSVLYTPEGEFSGFFGSNTVEVTAKLLLDQLWKKLLPQTATESISRYVPEEIASFCIDERDFIYTVTQTSTAKQKVKKLNSTGENILVEEDFGELEQEYVSGQLMTSRFVDIAVDDRGNIAVLDQQNNRVYQYDKEGTFLFVFGGTGTQNGTFSSVAAVETLGDKVLVLDSKKHNLTVFTPTEFGSTVHEAVDIYNEGQYSKATALWEEILRMDQNYLTGYISIGKALLADKQYKAAADYFKLGNDREGNSDAFQAYRNQIIQKLFPVICLVLVVLGVVFVWRFNRRPNKKEAKKTKYLSPFKFLLHPTDSAEEMKYHNSGSVLYAIVILLLWFFAVVFNYSLKGFRFNTNNQDEMNIILLLVQTVPLFLVWVFSNWGVTTLMDGKGKMKEIFISNAYCLIPYVTAIFVNIVLSWILVDNEQVFMTWILILGIGWSIAMLFGVLMGIHEYSVSKTVASVLLSALGVFIVIFLVLMIVSMVQQAYGFIYSIVNELLYRFK